MNAGLQPDHPSGVDVRPDPGSTGRSFDRAPSDLRAKLDAGHLGQMSPRGLPEIGVESHQGRGPLYVEAIVQIMPGQCHIEQAVIQQSKGGSALHRLAYQMNTYFNDGISHGDYGRFAGDHLGGVILLPLGAPAEFADDCNFVMAAGFREVRADAQAGRTIDFSLPRELPNELLIVVAAFAMAPFVAQGMAVRIDIECPLAFDKGKNPHAHTYLAQRYLEATGFGRKGREWNAVFLRNLGRYVRAVIAARVTLGCALLGVASHMDPRRNELRGLQAPEERISRNLWRMHDRGINVLAIEKLKADRQQKKATSDELPLRPEISEGPEPIMVRSAVYSRLPPSNEARQERINFVVPLALDAQAEACGSSSARAEIVLTTHDGSLTFDGETFVIEGTAGRSQAQLIVKLAKALDWPALVVKGDSNSADEIITAGVPLGLTAINVCASDTAIRLIQKNSSHLLADAIGPLDPCNVVGHLLKAKPDKVEKTDFASDMPDPKATPSDEEDHRRSGVLLSDPSMVVGQAVNGDPEADLTAFDLDMPEPKSDRGEEEKRRQRGALLWKTFLAIQSDRLEGDSGRNDREHGTPPKIPAKKSP